MFHSYCLLDIPTSKNVADTTFTIKLYSLITTQTLIIDSNIVRFFVDNMDILSAVLNNTSFDENDHKTIICITYAAWCNRFNQYKAFKKESRKKLMFAAWHQTR